MIRKLRGLSGRVLLIGLVVLILTSFGCRGVVIVEPGSPSPPASPPPRNTDQLLQTFLPVTCLRPESAAFGFLIAHPDSNPLLVTAMILNVVFLLEHGLYRDKLHGFFFVFRITG
jgi:hypothetical protein